ncbi:unnamed protein product [Clonostachys rosea f. rosea IK726]|uniref:Aspartate aminotransferase n=2 Tax=Bionectria ochroleuca TaxID=29856 RepID=A0A0B7KKF4_BIOOC|nr:unnamed protein product [Clonostachys rosea f. rosea IK726]
MTVTLGDIPQQPRDEAFALTADFKADNHPNKVSLSAGVYRDGNSKPWVLSSVREAKRILHEMTDLDHEYLPIQGLDSFLVAARDLILGKDSAATTNVVSLQTISGTGANHVGAAFLSQKLQPKNVFISDPTWSNHHLVWTVGAPNVTQRKYPYYDFSNHTLDFDVMMSTLEAEAEENDVVILHACSHNPTGADPSREQWQSLATLFKRRKLFAFFDSAYQGFATGDVEVDGWAVRHFQQTLFGESSADEDPCSAPPGMCIAQSFAKNFGLYGERVGAFHLILPNQTPAAGAKSELLRLVRAEISNPPLFGARIVQTILSDAKLRAMWEDDLRVMSGRITKMRSLLRQAIEEDPHSGDWSRLESQIGMFSFTGLSEKQVLRLREFHHIYLMNNGRISLSGVNEGNVKYIAEAFNEVLRQ